MLAYPWGNRRLATSVTLECVALGAVHGSMQATGATHVQLYSTWYQGAQGLESTAIAPYTASEDGQALGQIPSPLRSETDAELAATMAAAGELSLQVVISPRLDLNWVRQTSSDCFVCHLPSVKRVLFESTGCSCATNFRTI